jgi:hypothetical protein
MSGHRMISGTGGVPILIGLAVVLGVVGCLPKEPPTPLPDPVTIDAAVMRANRNLDRLTDTIRAVGFVDGYVTDPSDGGRVHFSGRAYFFYRRPGYVRFDLKVLGETQLLIGGNLERYWFYSQQAGDAYYCYRLDRTNAPWETPELPLEPTQIVEALGFTPIPTRAYPPQKQIQMAPGGDLDRTGGPGSTGEAANMDSPGSVEIGDPGSAGDSSMTGLGGSESRSAMRTEAGDGDTPPAGSWRRRGDDALRILPAQRIDGPYQQLLFVAPALEGWPRLEKEYWLDRRAPYLTRRVQFRDELGSLIMESRLDDYGRMGEFGPYLPTKISATWEGEQAMMNFEITQWQMTSAVGPDAPAFRPPHELGIRYEEEHIEP